MALTQTMFAVTPQQMINELGRAGRSRVIQRQPSTSQQVSQEQIQTNLVAELQTETVFAHWYDPDMAMEFMANAIMAANSPRIRQLESILMKEDRVQGSIWWDDPVVLPPGLENAAIRDLTSAWDLFFMALRSLNVRPYAWSKLRLVCEKAWGASNGSKSGSATQAAEWYRVTARHAGTSNLILGMQTPDTSTGAPWRAPASSRASSPEPSIVSQQHRLFPEADGTVVSFGDAFQNAQGVRAGYRFPATAARRFAGQWGPLGGDGPLFDPGLIAVGQQVESDWFTLQYTNGGANYCEERDCMCFMPPWRWYLDLLFGPISGLRTAITADGNLIRTPTTRMFDDEIGIAGRDLSLAEYVAHIGPNELVMEIYKDIVTNNNDPAVSSAASMSAVSSPAMDEWRAEQTRIRVELAAAQTAVEAERLANQGQGTIDQILQLGETAATALQGLGVTCPRGQAKVNGRCQAPAPTCPTGYARSGAQCLASGTPAPGTPAPAPVPLTCPSGFSLVGGVCTQPAAPTFGSSSAQQIASRTLSVVQSIGGSIPFVGTVANALPALIGIGEMIGDIFTGHRTFFSASANEVDCFGRPLAVEQVARYQAASSFPVTATTLERFRLIDVTAGNAMAFVAAFTKDALTMRRVAPEWKDCLQLILLRPEGHAAFGSTCAWLLPNAPCNTLPVGGGRARPQCPPGRAYNASVDLCCAPGAATLGDQCVEPELLQYRNQIAPQEMAPMNQSTMEMAPFGVPVDLPKPATQQTLEFGGVTLPGMGRVEALRPSEVPAQVNYDLTDWERQQEAQKTTVRRLG
jgi:hypothetical protein